MEVASLMATAPDGEELQASFLPQRGMNLISYSKGGREILAQSTLEEFKQRSAGLGAIIGPHFHHRSPHAIPPVRHEERFPHIALIRSRGIIEPFSHGVGRYAPWEYQSTAHEIKAELYGHVKWHGVPLRELEGQDFTMHYQAHLSPRGLELNLSVESAEPSVIGFHTYYNLVGGHGTISSFVQNLCRTTTGWSSLPKEWDYKKNNLTLPIKNFLDFGFMSHDPLRGDITLHTGDYSVHITYQSTDPDHSFQVWHPEGKPFVCIEPLSSATPRQPSRCQSRLTVLIRIDSSLPAL